MGSRTPTRLAENAAVTYLNTVQTAEPEVHPAGDRRPAELRGDRQQHGRRHARLGHGGDQRAWRPAIPTFVVGISAPAGAANDALNMMAVAGGYPRAGSPQYYPVTSAAEFAAVLQTLVTIAGTCVFPVPEPPNTDTDRNHIGVKVNGNELPQDTTHTNGWDYTSDAHTAVQIYGPNCDAIEAGTRSRACRSSSSASSTDRNRSTIAPQRGPHEAIQRPADFDGRRRPRARRMWLLADARRHR